MVTTKVDFTGVKWTMLMTLYLRAVESRDKNPVLGDHAAADAVERINYNFGSLKMRLTESDRFLVALRAKQLDLWAADFLSAHPEATVLQLGCGLDSRAFRLDVPAGARWFDVDYPEVIDLRRQLYKETDQYRMIASSVTDPAWPDEIPAEHPVLIIAEGLLMYLPEDEVRTLLRRLTDRFPTGALLFDGLLPWVVRFSNMLPPPFGSLSMGWAARDERQLEQWIPRLHHRETATVLAQHQKVPVQIYRVLYALLSRIPALRDMLRMFRYEF